MSFHIFTAKKNVFSCKEYSCISKNVQLNTRQSLCNATQCNTVLYTLWSCLGSLIAVIQYRNDPKFSNSYAWANSADPDQRSSLIRVYTVCHSVCIVWTHDSMVEPHSSNFRVIITNFLGIWIFKKFTVKLPLYYKVHLLWIPNIKGLPCNRYKVCIANCCLNPINQINTEQC